MWNWISEHKVLVLVLLAMLLLPSLAVAETAKATAAEPENESEVLTAVQIRMQQKVNVDFRETPIEDVLRMLGKQADVDIVKSPKVIGNVTATLTDVPLAEALDNILAAHGYGFIATENMIRIVPRADILNVQEKLVSKVYHVTYADVKELEKALTKFISTRGSISSMPGTSNLIVTDTESKIEAIDQFVKEVDRVTQQVLIEVRIYDVTDTENFDLDMQWNSNRAIQSADGLLYRPTTGGTLLSPDPITTSGSEVETLYHPVRHADPWVSSSFDKTNGGALRLGFLNDSVSLDLLLTALHKQAYATLLANPSILVLDNQEATFQIVKEIPYKDERQSSAGGSQTTTQFKEVGVELLVVPQITRDGLLRLHVVPEFGVAEEQLRTAEGLSLVPTINTRKLDTIALLRDGQTIVLGGLRKQEATKDLYKTPLLGDLPLLGVLFRSESETVETTELLVFITPKIIDEPTLRSDQAKTYKYTDIPKVDKPLLRRARSE